MAFPKIASFDARAFTSRLFERVRKADGGQYPIFNPAVEDSLVDFTQSVRVVRDAAAATAVFTADVKKDLDEYKTFDIARHNSLAQRVAALEAQPKLPFPASG